MAVVEYESLVVVEVGSGGEEVEVEVEVVVLVEEVCVVVLVVESSTRQQSSEQVKSGIQLFREGHQRLPASHFKSEFPSS